MTDNICMGLTICRNIVEKAGGQLYFHSAGEFKGAIFRFTMKMKFLTTETTIDEDQYSSLYDTSKISVIKNKLFDSSFL